jgi:hypothetical protein
MRCDTTFARWTWRREDVVVHIRLTGHPPEIVVTPWRDRDDAASRIAVPIVRASARPHHSLMRFINVRIVTFVDVLAHFDARGPLVEQALQDADDSRPEARQP